MTGLVLGVLVLDASRSVADATAAVAALAADLPDDEPLVLRLDADFRTRFHVDRLAAVARALASAGDDAGTLADVLDLWGAVPAPTRELSPGQVFSPSAPSGPVVLTSGRRVVGIQAPAAPPGLAQEDRRGGPILLDDWIQEEVAVGDGPPPVLGAVPAETGLYPVVLAPAQVVPGQEFEVTAGLTTTPGPDFLTGRAIPVTDEEQVFEVQFSGIGLSFPSGARAWLWVPAGGPARRAVDVRVSLPAVLEGEPGTTRMLRASFSQGGSVRGIAWRELLVSVDGQDDLAPGARAGGTAVAEPPDGVPDPPDLTLQILTRQDGAETVWVVDTPHEDVARPAGPVPGRLRDAICAPHLSAQMTKELSLARGRVVSQKLRGFGIQIADCVPVPVQRTLAAVWLAVTAQGRTPSLQLLVDDPHIPWELARMDDLLGEPRTLGALWRVGRWAVPPEGIATATRRPLIPPVADMEASEIAVLTGDYPIRDDLRHARREGERLRSQYGALVRTGPGAVPDLLENELERDGEQFLPDLVHVAAHGQAVPGQPQVSGLILDDAGTLLQETEIWGSPLARERRPFVYLNACQVGAGSIRMGRYAGLPGALVTEGARGVVAALWDVDDEAASRVADRFYREVLVNRREVAEVLREIRAGFDPRDPGTATELAYVFYGHPHLRVRWTPAADQG